MSKNIPLEILKTTNDIKDVFSELVNDKFLGLATFEIDKNYNLRLSDSDLESGFYFNFTKSYFKEKTGELIFEASQKPQNRRSVDVGRVVGNRNDILKAIGEWLTILDSYNAIIDDPILKNYQESFEADFEIIDEDAGKSPFNLNQQLLLEKYLEETKEKLIGFREGQYKDETESIHEIENDIEDIQKNLTRETKKKVINRLAKVWAKAQKIGLPVLREILIKASSELAVKLIGGG